MHDYLRVKCEKDSEFISANEGRNFILCDSLFQGGFGVPLDSKNSFGVQSTGDGTAPGGIKGRPGQVQVGGGAGWGTVSGGDEDLGLGFLYTDLDGDTERLATERESGFDSELNGRVLGLDYKLLDSLILGVTQGDIEEEALVAGGGGAFKTESDSQTAYITWAPSANVSIDIYYGEIDLDTASVRDFSFTSPTFDMEGIIGGAYQGEQMIRGVSINLDWYIGSWLLGGFAAEDSSDTLIDGYSETGMRTNNPGPFELSGSPEMGDPTGFEFSYSDQNIDSRTQTVGLRLGYVAEFEWAVLLPSYKVMAVRERENGARNIPISFASSPDTINPFTIETDEPDRYYNVESFGLVLAFNNGTQLFFDHEERSGHDYLDTESTTLGLLVAF